MIELLEEQLAEYQTYYNLLELACCELMKKGEDFDEYAKRAASYKIMIEVLKKEIDSFFIINTSNPGTGDAI